MRRRPGRDDVDETKPPGRRRSVAAAASTPSTAVRPNRLRPARERPRPAIRARSALHARLLSPGCGPAKAVEGRGWGGGRVAVTSKRRSRPVAAASSSSWRARPDCRAPEPPPSGRERPPARTPGTIRGARNSVTSGLPGLPELPGPIRCRASGGPPPCRAV